MQDINELKNKAKEEIATVKQQTLETLAKTEPIFEKKLKIFKQRQEESLIPKRYSAGEEIFNSITHGIGAGLSIAAIALLIIKAYFFAPSAEQGFYITGFALFGTTLFILYLMSTLYHALTPYHVKKIFAIFDHSSIYLLIAGTYTPFCLGVLRASVGWWLFGVIWGLTVAGIVFYSIYGSRMRILSVVSYIIMGWLVIFAWKPLSELLPSISLQLILGGGVAYMIGVIFYALKKIKWMHCIWHIFVIGGSILHFFAVYFSI